MPKLIRLFLGALFVYGSIPAMGMFYDSIASRNDFAGEILDRMERTKSEAAKAESVQFSNLWDLTLSADQKNKITETGNVMKERNLPTIPYYINLIRLINLMTGQNGIPPEKSGQALDVLQKVLLSSDNAAFLKYLNRQIDFIEHHCIYYSQYYKLYYTGQEYTFEFTGEEFLVVQDVLPLNESPEPEEQDEWGATEEFPATEEDQAATDDGWPQESDWGTGGTDDGWGAGDGWSDPLAETEVTSGESAGETSTEQVISGASYLPPVQGAVIKFTLTDFIFVTPYDSFSIQSTSGSWMANENLFVGNGGVFQWKSDSIGSYPVKTTLSDFAIHTDFPAIAAENTMLEYPPYLLEPIEGNFDYKSLNPRSPAYATYPRFVSYSNHVQINIPGNPNLKITGGFTVAGTSKTTRSLLPGKTSMMMADSTNRFYALGNYFEIGDSLITAPKTSLTIYQDGDSIHHQAVKFHYYPFKNYLLANVDGSKDRLSSFQASMYKMEIDADMIRWNLNSNQIDILVGQAKNILPATFESYHYYDLKYLESLSGFYRFNPLLMSVSYSRKRGVNRFLADDMAAFYKQNPAVVKTAMVSLDLNHFIDFDQNTGYIRMTSKAFHYADASSNKKDFDELQIKSISQSDPNASIDLSNNEMTIRGIGRFYISQVLDVLILPDSNRITMLKDRDMKFDGRLIAGNFEFVGRDFLFKYDSFYVDMTQIDSIRFYIDDLETGKKRRVDNKLVSVDSAKEETLNELATEFNQTTGRLFINRPDNKSGRKIYPGYPTFNAAQGAIVYFDNKEVLNGAYDESVYFVIPPFTIDSLSDSDPATIGFDGKFYPGKLLAPFEETLHVMPDNSLGFEHDIAPEGYTLYNGSARIFNKVKLDKNGLTGNGRIDYLSASLSSTDFTFYLDSLTGTGYDFVMREGLLNGGSFPDAAIDNFRLKWLPEPDSMYLVNIDKPFSLYHNTATLSGTFIVNRAGGFGDGELLTRNSITESRDYYFNSSRFGANHASFQIQSDDPEKPILMGEDVRLNFDLEQNFADIEPELEGVAAIEFPYAQFKTSIPNARWNLETRMVEMKKPEDVDLGYSYFYATREDLDSLIFNATEAKYNIDKFELLVSGIPYINVADAKITPENNEVLILENARIETLHNTSIVIDTLTEYHSLYNGTIDIVSRNKFQGSATYQYINEVKDTFAIRIDQFDLVEESDKTRKGEFHTMASGFINEADSVVISPGTIFKGKAIMYAPDPAFALDGFVKLEYRPNPQKDIWIKYASGETTSSEVMINFNSAVTEEDESLVAGIHYDENDQLYSTFINQKKSIVDRDFFIPDGMLFYDEDSSMYKIENPLKVAGDSYEGKIFNLNVRNLDVQFEGPVNFNIKTNDLELEASVVGSGNISKDSYRIDALLTLDFVVPPQATDILANEILEAAEILGLQPGYDDEPSMLYKIAGMIGEKSTRLFEEKSLQDYAALVSMSPVFNKFITISKADLNYHAANKAWYSTGKIGISNIRVFDINVSTDGFLEIRKAENGDMINLFIQVSPIIWYYFNFEENKLVVASSNQDFMDIIKSKSTSLKANFGQYFFVEGEVNDALSFVNRFRNEYLGITEPFEMDILPTEEKIEEKEENTDDGFGIKEEKEKEKEEDDEGF